MGGGDLRADFEEDWIVSEILEGNVEGSRRTDVDDSHFVYFICADLLLVS